MIFRGAYDDINGVCRPYITILVRSRHGVWIPLPFLIDSGADATFLDASCLQQIGTDPGAITEQTASGVGGKVAHTQLATALRFTAEATADSVRLGGTARSIAHAQVESWRAIAAFLSKLKR